MASNVSITTDRLTARPQVRMAKAGAVVIGGDYRGLGIVRSLGRRGIPVWVLTDQHLLAAASRYSRRHLPWPTTDEAQQVEYLLALGEQYRLDGWLLFPTGDETTALIARYHDRLERQFRLTVPPWEQIRWAYDKRCTYHFSETLGVDIPWTRYPTNSDEVAALDCDFPVILKPAIRKDFNPFTHDKAWRVEDREALVKRYDEACTFIDPSLIMVQEMIPGGGETQYSYAALCREGHPLAWLVARRMRQYPVDFGHSSSYVEVVTQAEVEQHARRLLSAIGYTGLVEIEFKYDIRDNRYKVLDVNPRVWGWHTLGRRAGVDFPYLLWRLIQGESLTEVRGCSGIRWVRMVTDLPAVVSEFRRGQLSLLAYLKSLKGPLEFAIFAADDPLPAVVEVPLLSYLTWKRGAL
ncbi:MAG: ATP-grasp domain-containing protein [Candidatus Binatia bacterium]